MEELIKKIEAELNSEWVWLVRSDKVGYFANIFHSPTQTRLPAVGMTPLDALQSAFNVYMIMKQDY